MRIKRKSNLAIKPLDQTTVIISGEAVIHPLPKRMLIFPASKIAGIQSPPKIDDDARLEYTNQFTQPLLDRVQTADIGTTLIDRLFFNDQDGKDDEGNLLENLKT